MLLITQTLLSAWLYSYTCREESAEEAYADFLSTLRREPHETTPEMQNGIDFENGVYALMKGEPLPSHCSKWEKGATAVATRLKGGQIQVKASRPICVDGEWFLVYGICDVLHAGVIHDVKFSNKSFGSAELAGKYFEKPQHPAYFYLFPEAYMFEYDVSDGTDLYTETYMRDKTPHIETIIREFVSSLNALGLMDTYRQYWQTK